MLKNKLESEVINGMDVPFQNDIRKGYEKAKAAHIHYDVIDRHCCRVCRKNYV